MQHDHTFLLSIHLLKNTFNLKEVRKRYTEIELKYKLNEKQKANVPEDIVESFHGTIIKEKHMKAVYMDTMDNDLAKRK